jgi:hypothetical protein
MPVSELRMTVRALEKAGSITLPNKQKFRAKLMTLMGFLCTVCSFCLFTVYVPKRSAARAFVNVIIQNTFCYTCLSVVWRDVHLPCSPLNLSNATAQSICEYFPPWCVRTFISNYTEHYTDSRKHSVKRNVIGVKSLFVHKDRLKQFPFCSSMSSHT